ncbi:MAG: F0F1 ATP synthase subunit gamma [Pseudomonadota bacterium]
MPSLKDLRNRIDSVKSTRKITSAMKMVAASKLRRAQDQAEAGQPYADRMGGILSSLAGRVTFENETPKLLAGTGKEDTYLLVAITADRGLCGGFNTQIVRLTRKRVAELTAAGKTVRLMLLGRKARQQLRRTPGAEIVEGPRDFATSNVGFDDAKQVTDMVMAEFETGGFDVCELLFNEFKSVISQVATAKQVIPAAIDAEPEAANDDAPPAGAKAEAGHEKQYEFEPDEEAILADLLPRNLAVQVYSALLASAAGEQAARMTAMDNATRNAGDMINRLTLDYNRSRQAQITKELIEIISGAEAV